jgi:hypothetical protein
MNTIHISDKILGGGVPWPKDEAPEDLPSRLNGHIGVLCSTMNSEKLNISLFRNSLKSILENESWREFFDEERWCIYRHQSFESFVTSPKPDGLAESLENIRDLIGADVALLDLLDRAVQKPGHRPASVTLDNIQGSKEAFPSGTSSRAGLRRLRKDRPDLHRRVLEDGLSVNAACVEAGFRHRTVTVPLDPVRAVQTLARRFSAEEWAEVVQLVNAIHHPARAHP